jgi:hypothetical protein
VGELLDKTYGGVIARMPSDRDKNVAYDIRRKADGALTCSCVSFQFRFDCKHLRRYREQLALQEQS